MTGHTSSIHSLSFCAESTVLVSGSADSTVRVWDVLAVPAVVVEGKKLGGGAFEGGIGTRRVTASVVGVAEGDNSDLLATLATKRTPVLDVHFTPRNLVLVAGPMQDL
jgi:transcription initiation factor TFIID subunit 5